jgi:hypothetical protein
MKAPLRPGGSAVALLQRLDRHPRRLHTRRGNGCRMPAAREAGGAVLDDLAVHCLVTRALCPLRQVPARLMKQVKELGARKGCELTGVLLASGSVGGGRSRSSRSRIARFGPSGARRSGSRGKQQDAGCRIRPSHRLWVSTSRYSDTHHRPSKMPGSIFQSFPPALTTIGVW